MAANFKITKLTPKYRQGAIDVLRDAFFTDEKVCNCVGILTDSPEVPIDDLHKCTKASLELEALCTDITNDGVTLVAVDQETDQVLGVAYNKIQVRPPPGEKSYFEKFAENNVHDPATLALVDYMIKVDSKIDIFEVCNAQCGLELTFLGVKNAAKGRGIGRSLIEETIQLAKQYDGFPKPEFVCAIFSSRFSQKAGERAGMEVVMEDPYCNHEYKGKKFSDITGPDHPFATLSLKKL